jgi:transcriptional regulator with AAA-type ATPase domain
MNTPVFEHTICSLHAVINNEEEPLQKISDLIKYDPGLYFSLLQNVNSISTRSEITSIYQAASLIGAEGIENHILQQDYFLDEKHLLLWCYAVIAGEAAAAINEKAHIAEEEEAFFSGILPSVGMLLMLMKYRARYEKIIEPLLRVPTEHKIFIENKLLGTSLLEQIDRALSSPKIYRDTVSLMSAIFTKDGRKRNHLEYPARFSVAYKSFQLLQLMDVSESAARAILFPAVVEAQEKFRENSKRFFKIPENEVEEILADIVERFEDICREFKVEGLSEKFISAAEDYRFNGVNFITKSGSLKKSLDMVYTANREEKNIFIYGEPSTGKRLLAIALHYHPENPRRTEPFLSFHCAAMDSETLEKELFGAKGGFMGIEKHKGALETASGGTILLKDVDRIPLTLQDRLAEIFCKSESYKIGDIHPIYFDIRFLITSQKNIFEESKEGRFSERLLRVLKPVSIYIPPLRERREDIEFIAGAIIEKYNLGLTDSALHLGLQEYYEKNPFSENLRDLKRLLFYLSARHRLIS